MLFRSLKNKYPHLVCRKSPLELWGVETEEGWDNLVMDFIIEIDKYIKDNNIEDFNILQIKQKFGQLRVYYGATTVSDEHFSKLTKILEKYEKLASKTCEKCGKPGSLKTINYWATVRCEKHSK